MGEVKNLTERLADSVSVIVFWRIFVRKLQAESTSELDIQGAGWLEIPVKGRRLVKHEQ